MSDGVDLCKDCPDEPSHETAHWTMAWRIDKYDGEVTPEMIAAGAVEPVEVVEIEGNMLLNAGVQRLLDLLIGAGGQALDATHSRIGAGDSSTAAVATQTDLQAAAGTSHRQFKLVTGVSRTGQFITWTATFATTEANFAWNEMGIDAGTADSTAVVAPLLNRRVVSLGTKTSAQTWSATGTLTIT